MNIIIEHYYELLLNITNWEGEDVVEVVKVKETTRGLGMKVKMKKMNAQVVLKMMTVLMVLLMTVTVMINLVSNC